MASMTQSKRHDNLSLAPFAPVRHEKERVFIKELAFFLEFSHPKLRKFLKERGLLRWSTQRAARYRCYWCTPYAATLCIIYARDQQQLQYERTSQHPIHCLYIKRQSRARKAREKQNMTKI